MLNKVILMGRLTADPELKSTPNGVSVTSFSLAVDRQYSGKDNEKKTDFINFVAWRGNAEFICRYFHKGKMMVVEGELQTRSYTDNNQNKRIATEVLVKQPYFAGDTGTQKPQQPQQQPAAQTYNTPTPPVSFNNGSIEDFQEIDDEDDLPF